MTSEKFCLKWNDFQNNIISSYQELRKELDFSDVTLVCEEDHQVEAHKIILTACSPFFSNILKRNKHPHPMLYMRGMKAKDLVAIVDFIYHVSHVRCQVSGGRCHVAGVRCHMSGVSFMLIVYYNFIFQDKVVELVGGGSVINGAYPV
jgi:hypothetical protein